MAHEESGRLAGVFDLHVHAGPDVRARKLDALALARKAKAAGMAGLLLKSHHTITADLGAVVEEAVGGIRVVGAVTLNDAVGGLNPEAVTAALALGAKQVFMPTFSAAHHRRFEGRSGGLSVLRGHVVRDEVKAILDLVAAADVMLGTAHLSPDEILALAGAARSAGVRKLVVSHPEIEFLALPIDLQHALAVEGAYFERMHLHGNSHVDWPGLATIMRAVGIERTVLVTDLGAAGYAWDPVDGMADMLAQLAAQGFTEDELDRMARRTPATLLGVDFASGRQPDPWRPWRLGDKDLKERQWRSRSSVSPWAIRPASGRRSPPRPWRKRTSMPTRDPSSSATTRSWRMRSGSRSCPSS